MKVLKIITIFSVLFFCFGATVNATDGEARTENWLEEFNSILSENSASSVNPDDLISKVGIDALLDEILSAVKKEGGVVLSFLMLLFGIAVLMSVAENGLILADSALFKGVNVGISVISSVLIFGRIGEACHAVLDGLEKIGNFISASLPVLTGISAASGNVNSAAVQALNINITLAAVERISNEVLTPLVFALFSLSMVSGLDGGGVSSIAKNIKGCFTWVLGISATVTVGAMSLQSLVASATDGAYLRAAKYAATGLIPVVGGAVSAAMSSLAGGLSYIKSTVGVSVVAVILTFALPPLIMLLLYRLAFSVNITFLEIVSCNRGVRIFNAFRGALDALLAMYSISTIIYICEIVIFMKSGVAVFG